MAHITGQRGKAGENIVGSFFLSKGISTFSPDASSSRDLMIEIDGKFYGVQVKTVSRVDSGKSKRRRYRFYVKRNSKDGDYDPKKVHIYCFVVLNKFNGLVLFEINKGNRSAYYYYEDQITFESQDKSFKKLLKNLQLAKV